MRGRRPIDFLDDSIENVGIGPESFLDREMAWRIWAVKAGDACLEKSIQVGNEKTALAEP
jgi:hypothetical protein